MKLFTLDEANSILPKVAKKLEKLQLLYSIIGGQREEAQKAASASEFGGGMPGGTKYVRDLYLVGKITTEINDLGVQLKDYERGLVDFPSIQDGRVVLLCWQLGECDQIKWWHEVDTGFAGRRPVNGLD